MPPQTHPSHQTKPNQTKPKKTRKKQTGQVKQEPGKEVPPKEGFCCSVDRWRPFCVVFVLMTSCPCRVRFRVVVLYLVASFGFIRIYHRFPEENFRENEVAPQTSLHAETPNRNVMNDLIRTYDNFSQFRPTRTKSMPTFATLPGPNLALPPCRPD